MTMRPLALVLLLVTAACSAPARMAPAPASVRVALVDSVPYQTELEDGFLRRVEVRMAAGVDTLPEVTTSDPPLVLADGTVLGFHFQGPDMVRAFSWHPARRVVEPIELPEDADRWFTAPAFSPDGRHLAYVAYQQGASFGRGMVRRGASGEIVVQTEWVEVPATDAAINFVRWSDARSFEIFLDVASGWHRFTGTIADGVIRQDTVAPPLPPP